MFAGTVAKYRFMSPNEVEELAKETIANNPTDDWIYEELGRLNQGDNAFGDQLVTRGKQIVRSTSLIIGDRLCSDPALHDLAERADTTAGDVLVILPLVISLLAPADMQSATIALIAVMISRMGLRSFCAKYGNR